VPAYAPLWCKSNFSFLEGASHAEELVEEAHRLGIGSLALTDRDGVYGMVRAHVKARDLGVQLVCGAQVSIAASGAQLVASPVSVGLHGAEYEGRGPGWGQDTDDLAPEVRTTGRRSRARRTRPRQIAVDVRDPPVTSQLVVLAIDRAGWANLTRLLTAGRRRCDKGCAMVAWSEVCQYAGGLLALWGGEGSVLADEPEPPRSLIGELREAFGDRLYAMVTRHRQSDDVARERPRRASRWSPRPRCSTTRARAGRCRTF